MKDEIEEAIGKAVRYGTLDEIRENFRLHPEYVKRLYRGARNWITEAVFAKKPDAIRLLVELGCEIDRAAIDVETPLWDALGEDNVDAVQALLECGANPNGKRCVIAAVSGVSENSLDMLKLLEKHGADLNRVEMNEITGEPMNALSEAIAWDKADVVAYLRSKGVQLPNTSAI
ncbi:MAG: ankyrin repeat domain-containing protein [Planctomycetota bacterium]